MWHVEKQWNSSKKTEQIPLFLSPLPCLFLFVSSFPPATVTKQLNLHPHSCHLSPILVLSRPPHPYLWLSLFWSRCREHSILSLTFRSVTAFDGGGGGGGGWRGVWWVWGDEETLGWGRSSTMLEQGCFTSHLLSFDNNKVLKIINWIC